MSAFEEKRQFARAEVNAAVRYRIDGADIDIERDGWLGNISASGILLWAEQELPLGATLYLRLTADEFEGTELEVTATVVRADPARPDGLSGYGCRFEALYSGPLVE